MARRGVLPKNESYRSYGRRDWLSMRMLVGKDDLKRAEWDWTWGLRSRYIRAPVPTFIVTPFMDYSPISCAVETMVVMVTGIPSRRRVHPRDQYVSPFPALVITKVECRQVVTGSARDSPLVE